MKKLTLALALFATTAMAQQAPMATPEQVDVDLAHAQLDVLKAQKVLIARQRVNRAAGEVKQDAQMDKQIAALQKIVDDAVAK